jgi:hypothetical protein
MLHHFCTTEAAPRSRTTTGVQQPRTAGQNSWRVGTGGGSWFPAQSLLPVLWVACIMTIVSPSDVPNEAEIRRMAVRALVAVVAFFMLWLIVMLVGALAFVRAGVEAMD